MLQFQTHLENGTVYLCHTRCDILTILMGNNDVINPHNYTAPVVNSGLIDFVYTAPTLPMSFDQWPTLAEMIFSNQRAVVMLDYEANQEEIPWLLDEFSQMFETPFSPTDRDFPCTAQRPSNQALQTRDERMFMMNQNLNLEISLGGISFDIPASNLVNETNAIEGYGSAGA
ncbi:hypothetical protein LTR84_013196 [Exophiala bonariae]|uniref:Uncharacterized protein n=1 Tax=Exophiala bonariae TaxID=1690606 RepID=A0AAV9MU29_9EURO|nr:hypothetical protein LTR84_013196 [Exophiala bonariae]